MSTGVWSDAPAGAFAAPLEWLQVDDAVRARISSLRDWRDRRAHLAARALAASGAAQVLGVDRTEVRLVQTCGSCGAHSHGRPSVSGHPELVVSWAHTRDHVAAATSGSEVAIDVEDPVRSCAAVNARVLTAEEGQWWARTGGAHALARLWCRKECAVKLGWVTLDELTDVSFVARGSLLEHVRGMTVLEKPGRRSPVVALTRDRLVRVPPGPPRATR